MLTNIFAGIPDYVRITILAQVKLLMKTNLFSENDKEDVIQDLLLFYIKQFYKKTVPDEAYVVTSIQNQAKILIRTKVRRHFGLFLSLDDLDIQLSAKDEFKSREVQIMFKQILDMLSEKEKPIILQLASGKSIEEVSRERHVAKITIYKLFEKIRNFSKK